MKKTLALILTIVMVCAFATTAFAATDIVGDYNNDNVTGVAKGDDSFTVKNNAATIAITATNGQVEHRYAVDIDYLPMTFNISSSTMVWDVVDLKYVLESGDENTMDDQTFDVIITNRSDEDIYLNTNVADGDGDDGVLVTTNVVANTPIISAITGTTTPYTFTVTVQADTEHSKDWAYVSNYYATKFAAEPTTTSYTVATLTLSLSLTTA